jgi:hypothetical protein
MRAKATWTSLSSFVGLFAGLVIHRLFSGNPDAEYHFILYSLYFVGLACGIFVVRHICLSYRLEQIELLEKLKLIGEPNTTGITSN